MPTSSARYGICSNWTMKMGWGRVGKKILVTGGAGFIGSHIADAFLARGDRVWILDDLSTGKPENVPPGAELVEGSISDPIVSRLFEQAGGFDIVSHHAAQIDVRRSVNDPRYDARINIDGLLRSEERRVGKEGGLRDTNV